MCLVMVAVCERCLLQGHLSGGERVDQMTETNDPRERFGSDTNLMMEHSSKALLRHAELFDEIGDAQSAGRALNLRNRP